jgi:hypothetical protein
MCLNDGQNSVQKVSSQRTISSVPKMMIPCEGHKSMIMLKVSHIFASANQEKIMEKMLYYKLKISSATAQRHGNVQGLEGERRTSE